MVARYPSAEFNANSKAKLSIHWHRKSGFSRFEISTTAVLLLSIPLVLLMVWYLVATFYFVFRDDMLAKLLSNQAETQYAYEDRIASLRVHLDRVATRQLVSQDSFEDRVNELIARQSQLETRQAVVSALISETQKHLPRAAQSTPSATQATTGSIPSSTGTQTSNRGFMPVVPVPSPSGGPFWPIQPSGSFAAPQKSDLFSGDHAELRLGDGPKTKPAVNFQWADRVALGLTRIEQNQVASLSTLESYTRAKITRMHVALAETGLSPRRFSLQKSTDTANMGGPLEPIKANGTVAAFDQTVLRLSTSIHEASRAAIVLQALPLARPLQGEAVVTSTFGARNDPFLHTAAMHTGIDLKAPYGNEARATSAGRVISAGHQGGYGNMVEIDHGYGLTTRYAHLSSISVDIGDTVSKGETIGLVGSTGRSTGPHLHYETRIDGEATDPMRFLNAAARLGVR